MTMGKKLVCATCCTAHDFDFAPDTGECIVCGGFLIEDESERGLVGGKVLTRVITDAVTDGLAAVAIKHGKIDHGTN